jgi:tRNA U34 5-methylaminomethyl-2-thiouridine-forming methyltransferase MnmC
MLTHVGLDTHPDLLETFATLSRRDGAIVTPAAELLIRRTLQEPGHG